MKILWKRYAKLFNVSGNFELVALERKEKLRQTKTLEICNFFGATVQ